MILKKYRKYLAIFSILAGIGMGYISILIGPSLLLYLGIFCIIVGIVYLLRVKENK